jgi:hypothetical protein
MNLTAFWMLAIVKSWIIRTWETIIWYQMATKTETLITEVSSSERDDTSLNKAERTLPSRDEAVGLFRKVKNKLRNVEQWSEHSGVSYFAVFDETGDQPGDHEVKEGRFIRIQLPGTGMYDWVRVENVHETDEEMVVTVRPTHDPTAEPVDKEVISHFFAPTATNNFCALLRGNTVGAYVIGTGEKQNTSDTSGILETVRNAAVANLGSYLGLQSAEWTKFCNSLLSEGEGKGE